MFDEPVPAVFRDGRQHQKVSEVPIYSRLTVIWKFYDDSFGSNTRLGYGAAIAYTLFLIIGSCSLFSFFSATEKKVGGCRYAA